jgi:hypothetical protein
MMIYVVSNVSISPRIRSLVQYFGAGVCYTDITSRVTFFGEFTSEEFIEFGAEDTVCDELALFADLGGHLED